MQVHNRVATHMLNARALLFDLGGVVLEFDFGRAFASWAAASGADPNTLRRRFGFDDAYKQHERGQIDASQYFAHLRCLLQVDLSDDALATGWNAIFVGEMPRVRAILTKLAGCLPLYAFTNSNPTHIEECRRRFPEVLDLFRKVFVSSAIGKRKPEADAFQEISRALREPLEQIMFFDDSQENVHAAQALGMPAVHIRTTHDIERATEGLIA